MKLDREVFCTIQFVAGHCWPDAPDSHSYLRNLHRHIFHVKAWAKVKHNERDIEFIDLKERISKYLATWIQEEMTNSSCETVAERILGHFPELYKVEVSEDNENGAIVRRRDG